MRCILNGHQELMFLAIIFLRGIQLSKSLSCFQCHGTSISDVTSSCWETANEEHARFVSLVGCDGGSCALIVLNHTSIKLTDFTRTCEHGCQDSCFDTPFGTKLCKYCCKSDKCNAVLPQHKNQKKYENSSSPSSGNIKTWMNKLFAKSRHHSTGPSNKFHMRHEILKLMQEFIPEVQKQEVSVSDVVEEDRAPENFRSFIRTTSSGYNLIGISPGVHYKTSMDHIVIIMAHYDTFPDTPGVDDNGSGVSVLLELARIFQRKECGRNNTIVFVATDFNEHGIYSASPGENQLECISRGLYVHNVGATHFVCAWLLPHLREYHGRVSLAINLDTVMNVYAGRTARRKIWPKSFVRTLKAYKPHGRSFLKESNRKSSSNWWMVKASTTAFNRLLTTASAVSPNLKNEMFLYLQLNTSDQSLRFTEVKKLLHKDDCAPFHEVQGFDLPCLTISDTGEYRGYMKRCHHSDCDTVEELDERRLRSLVTLSTTLVNTISNLAKSLCVEDNEPSTNLQPVLCNKPLIQKNRQTNDIFMSATCARTGTTLEMCPPLGEGVWATINSDTAWIPRKVKKIGEVPLWFQVDFTEDVNISAIAIQGVRRKGYVRSYMVSYSHDESTWEWLVPETAQWDKEERRVEFRGNTNSRGVSKQEVTPAVTARFIRIFPRWWRKRIAMRIQIYGCRLGAI